MSTKFCSRCGGMYSADPETTANISVGQGCICPEGPMESTAQPQPDPPACQTPADTMRAKVEDLEG